MEIMSWSENLIWVWWVEYFEWKYVRGENFYGIFYVLVFLEFISFSMKMDMIDKGI